jgi:hypothetical protein
MNMIDQGGNGNARERRSGWLSRSRIGWGTLAGGLALALIAAPNSASAGSTKTNTKRTIHADILVTNSSLGAGGSPLGGALLGYSAGQKNAQKPVTNLVGNSTLLFGSSGVTVDFIPDGPGIEGVTDGLANLVTFYQLGANGNTSPIALFADDPTQKPAFPLNLDTGISPEPDGDVWISNLSPLICATTDLAECQATSPPPDDICGSGTLVNWVVGDPLPQFILGGCPFDDQADASAIVAPIGVFVDEVEVTVCEPEKEKPSASQGNCQEGQVEITYDDFETPRVWAVESGLGAVTLHIPFLGEDLGLAEETSFLFPSPTDNVFFSEPPIGGLFFVTTDNLPPAESADTTSPRYIALGEQEGEAYITDISLGKRRNGTQGEFGRIKEFSLTSMPTQTCVEFDTEYMTCERWWQWPVVSGAFDTSIEGRGTQLNVPQGIVAFTADEAIESDGDFIMVVNTGNNTVTEYAPGASGNAKPDAVLSSPGGKTGTLNLPVGIALAPRP